MADVTLEPMAPAEYARFWEDSFLHHARELMDQEGLSAEQAQEDARKELEEMLPAGLDTLDNFLMTIRTEGQNVGFLWFLTEWHQGTKQSFLCDFAITPVERRKGYGLSALKKWESAARSLNCRECVLFVSDDNEAAKALYSKCGFSLLRKHSYGEFRKKSL